jgi:hypothetical protein
VKWSEVKIFCEMCALSLIYSYVAVCMFCAVRCVIIVCCYLSFYLQLCSCMYVLCSTLCDYCLLLSVILFTVIKFQCHISYKSKFSIIYHINQNSISYIIWIKIQYLISYESKFNIIYHINQNSVSYKI